MAEIKTELLKLGAGDSYTAGDDCYIITTDHTIADIVRYAISCADITEVEFILNKEKAE